MTRPYKLEVDEEMHCCPSCNQDAQYYTIIAPDGVGMGTSYAMSGKDDAEEMVDMLNDAYEAGELAIQKPYTALTVDEKAIVNQYLVDNTCTRCHNMKHLCTCSAQQRVSKP